MKVYVVQIEESSGIPERPELFIDPHEAQERYAEVVSGWAEPRTLEEVLAEDPEGSVTWNARYEPQAFFGYDDDRTIRAWAVEL